MLRCAQIKHASRQEHARRRVRGPQGRFMGSSDQADDVEEDEADKSKSAPPRLLQHAVPQNATGDANQAESAREAMLRRMLARDAQEQIRPPAVNDGGYAQGLGHANSSMSRNSSVPDLRQPEDDGLGLSSNARARALPSAFGVPRGAAMQMPASASSAPNSSYPSLCASQIPSPIIQPAMMEPMMEQRHMDVPTSTPVSPPLASLTMTGSKMLGQEAWYPHMRPNMYACMGMGHVDPPPQAVTQSGREHREAILAQMRMLDEQKQTLQRQYYNETP